MAKINFLNKQILFFFLEQRIKIKFELILVLSYENKVQTLVIILLLVTFNQNVRLSRAYHSVIQNKILAIYMKIIK